MIYLYIASSSSDFTSSLVWKPQCKQSAGLDAVQVYCLENVRDFLSVKGAVLKKVDGLCLNW